jgi:hypothetical protein
MISHEDINGDGFVDLLAHFDIENLEADNTTTELVLTGNTFSGTEVQGADSVHIVPKAKNSILQNWLTKKEKIVEIVRNIFKYYFSHFK